MEGEAQNFNFLDALVIMITLALLGFFIVFMAVIMAYFKTVALTIKTILKAAFEAQSPFLAFRDDIATIKHTKLREEAEMNMKETGIQHKYFTRWTVILEQCPSKAQQNDDNNEDLARLRKTKFNLLNPPFVFYAFIYT